MTRRNSRGWLTVEQLREGHAEQAAIIEPDGVVAELKLEHQDDTLGGGFYVILIRRRNGDVIETREWSFAKVDDARDRFTHTQRRIPRRH